MNHIVIPATGRSMYLPEELAECDERQYIEMAALIFRFQCNEITYEELRVQALYKLLDMRQGKSVKNEVDKFSNIYRLSLLINSFFDEDDNQNKIIRQHYTDNPIPSFRNMLHTYSGPSNGFDNVKVGEYLAGLNHFLDYHQTGETEYLYKLLATFYRRRLAFIPVRKYMNTYKGDDRQRYESHSVEERAQSFKKQHVGIVFGFHLLFASFQKYLTTAVVFIEGREIDLSVLFDDDGQSKRKESDLPGLGLKSLVYSFAETGVFGTLNEIEQMPIWEFFLRMYDLVKKNKDFEANDTSKK